ncbi:hypothetical protein CEXT_54841 [Caerostris extrusa]|uniref:Uncharacterized protein n=1 Tax=Caerostris extrusa TaxID=172846 RepID=A0AAV4XBT4_CAEEX|nr:hypothetical protein CEXT_54841 [Caerostris extrusa]
MFAFPPPDEEEWHFFVSLDLISRVIRLQKVFRFFSAALVGNEPEKCVQFGTDETALTRIVLKNRKRRC